MAGAVPDHFLAFIQNRMSTPSPISDETVVLGVLQGGANAEVASFRVRLEADRALSIAAGHTERDRHLCLHGVHGEAPMSDVPRFRAGHAVACEDDRGVLPA